MNLQLNHDYEVPFLFLDVLGSLSLLDVVSSAYNCKEERSKAIEKSTNRIKPMYQKPSFRPVHPSYHHRLSFPPGILSLPDPPHPRNRQRYSHVTWKLSISFRASPRQRWNTIADVRRSTATSWSIITSNAAASSFSYKRMHATQHSGDCIWTPGLQHSSPNLSWRWVI